MKIKTLLWFDLTAYWPWQLAKLLHTNFMTWMLVIVFESLVIVFESRLEVKLVHCNLYNNAYKTIFNIGKPMTHKTRDIVKFITVLHHFTNLQYVITVLHYLTEIHHVISKTA